MSGFVPYDGFSEASTAGCSSGPLPPTNAASPVTSITNAVAANNALQNASSLSAASGGLINAAHPNFQIPQGPVTLNTAPGSVPSLATVPKPLSVGPANSTSSFTLRSQQPSLSQSQLPPGMLVQPFSSEPRMKLPVALNKTAPNSSLATSLQSSVSPTSFPTFVFPTSFPSPMPPSSFPHVPSMPFPVSAPASSFPSQTPNSYQSAALGHPSVRVPQPYGERFAVPNLYGSNSAKVSPVLPFPGENSANLGKTSFTPPLTGAHLPPLPPTTGSNMHSQFLASKQFDGETLHNGNFGSPNRYPQPPSTSYQQQQANFMVQNYGASLPGQNYLPSMNAIQQDFSQLGFGSTHQSAVTDLMQDREVFRFGTDDEEVKLPNSVCNPEACCSPSIFRCTLKQVPQNEELLKKSRLPFGLTLHPFRDMKSLNVIQAATIVRCRYCRTYINPYVYLVDNRHWKCNLCYRSNDLPDDFSWDPVTKSFGEPTRRPEIRNATVEFIAPSEYMLRPPQPAVYVFIIDVSHNAIESVPSLDTFEIIGYLYTFAEQLLLALDHLPGDDRTAVGFIAVDRSIHFFQFHEASTPRQLIIDDFEDPFLPVNTGLLVNLKKNLETVRAFVQNLPSLYEFGRSNDNCLGAALKIAHALIADIGGRITVFQTILPTVGTGGLSSREDPNKRATNDVRCLVPATDFYKQLALECTGHQVAIDLFLLGTQYSDLSTLADMAKFSSGCIYHYSNYHMNRNLLQVKRFQKQFSRYLTRKIGFEAVLRIRCTRGLSLHTFYGNFFVRSTDLLAMANINPDSAFGVQVQLEEDLNGLNSVCFQAALLYTSSKGDRRIRIHTLCLPVTKDLTTVYRNFDLKCSVSLLTKMASERVLSGRSLEDSREAMVNAVVDAFSSFNNAIAQQGNVNALLSPTSTMRLFPLAVLGMLKHSSFAFGRSTKLDDRAAFLLLFRTAPLEVIELEVLPSLYHLNYFCQAEKDPPRLRLSYECISIDGVYLMDTGSYVFIYIGSKTEPTVLNDLFGTEIFAKIDEEKTFEMLDNVLSKRVHTFLRSLQSYRSVFAPVVLIRDDSQLRELFINRLTEDRTESSHSYVEFLRHVRQEMQR